MLGTLRRDAADRLPDLPPTAPLMPGDLCRRLAQALGRPSKEIGESKCSE
jgi:hypothetical protein